MAPAGDASEKHTVSGRVMKGYSEPLQSLPLAAASAYKAITWRRRVAHDCLVSGQPLQIVAEDEKSLRP